MDETLYRSLAVALFAGPLLVAAGFDAVSFRIPNLLTAVHALLFGLAAVLSPAPVGWLGNVAACAIFLVGGFALFSMRLLGGGDVKLLASAALWLGLSNAMLFLGLVGLLGGLWTVLLVVLRRIAVPAFSYTGFPAVRLPRILVEKPVPYGVSIAAAGLMMVPYLPLAS